MYNKKEVNCLLNKIKSGSLSNKQALKVKSNILDAISNNEANTGDSKVLATINNYLESFNNYIKESINKEQKEEYLLYIKLLKTNEYKLTTVKNNKIRAIKESRMNYLKDRLNILADEYKISNTDRYSLKFYGMLTGEVEDIKGIISIEDLNRSWENKIRHNYGC
ncbi:hypothetical protein [Clostridium sp. 1001283B150210_160208_E6]|uniref:hypothetical protein n=1 Tax=Clostridium sp. 1001283B150210_160208_E6 TaxID=2787129 RepID=UPI0018AAE74D|nr:hypothetical protein [Clostridium sp. 1001283B150210_160208_E6]